MSEALEPAQPGVPSRRHRLAVPPPAMPALAIRANALMLVLVNVGTGGTYLVVALSGATSAASSPTLQLIQVIAPLWFWAVALITAGGLIAAKQYVPGHTIAVVVWGFWIGCSALTIVLGTTTGAGGIWILLQLLGQHLIALSWRRRDARQSALRNTLQARRRHAP